MSDTIRSFIPCEPFFRPTAEQCEAIQAAMPRHMRLVLADCVQFADAGANFESVSCPFCDADLMGWWGSAMDAAYTKATRHFQLDIKTPCCGRATSLNDLRYNFPQGFYSAMLTAAPNEGALGDEDTIRQKLHTITGVPWRMIVAHY